MVVALLLVGAQPAYICAVHCMLAHGGAPVHARVSPAGGHRTDGRQGDRPIDGSPCQGAQLTGGVIGAVSPPSPAVVARSLAYTGSRPSVSITPWRRPSGAPRPVHTAPEPPPPRA